MCKQNCGAVPTAYELSLSANEADDWEDKATCGIVRFHEPIFEIERANVLNLSAQEVFLVKVGVKILASDPEWLVSRLISGWEYEHLGAVVTPNA